jgi:hypothetical protein
VERRCIGTKQLNIHQEMRERERERERDVGSGKHTEVVIAGWPIKFDMCLVTKVYRTYAQ